MGFDELPSYISVETECAGDHEELSEEEILLTLDVLNSLGYRHFKLIDQTSLSVLSYGKRFYTNTRKIGYSIMEKFDLLGGNRRVLWKQFAYKFPFGASGPFGEDTNGDWMNFEQAKETLLFHRKDYFNLIRSKNYGFWCDWHAKR